MLPFRSVARCLFRSWTFTAVVVCILGFGLGINTLIYSLTDSVLYRPLPFPEQHALAALWEQHPLIGRQEVSGPDFLDWQARNHTFSTMGAYTVQGYARALWHTSLRQEPLQTTLASSTLFATLGVSPLIGRFFTQNEDQAGRDSVVVLSNRLWQERFAADPAVIGKMMVLDGEAFQVVGILPPNVSVPRWADIWLPLSRAHPNNPQRRASHALQVIGQLKPGTSIAEANADIHRIAEQLAAEYPTTNGPTRAYCIPLRESYVGSFAQPLTLLQAGSWLMLLICIANAAVFSSVRAREKQHDTALRIALGASQARLAAESVFESLLLTAGAACVGSLFAASIVPVVSRQVDRFLPFPLVLSVDWRILGLSLATCLFCAMLFSAAVLWTTLRRSALPRGSSRVAAENRPAQGMVFVQTALTVVVLVLTSLLVQSFRNILAIDPGFATRQLLTIPVSLGKTSSHNSTPEEFYARLQSQLMEMPGVSNVAAAYPPLLTRTAARFWIEGRTEPEPDKFPVAQFRLVTPGFFPTARIGLRSGRLPRNEDADRPLVWVNQAFARTFFGQASPVGQVLLQGVFQSSRRRLSVAGVVGDVRDLGLDVTPEPTVYVVTWPTEATLLIRTTPESNLRSLQPAILQMTANLESSAWFGSLHPMEDLYRDAIRGREQLLALAAMFAAAACLLAVSGTGAVTARSVYERRRELAVRLAVGATNRQLMTMLIGQQLRSVCAGVIAGTLATVFCEPLVRTFLFGMERGSVPTYSASLMFIVVLCAAAAYMPAQRWSRLDIARTLKSE